jgi:hypothetical protein
MSGLFGITTGNSMKYLLIALLLTGCATAQDNPCIKRNCVQVYAGDEIITSDSEEFMLRRLGLSTSARE